MCSGAGWSCSALANCPDRVIRTLRMWNIRIDEALFLGGLDKREFLKAFGADYTIRRDFLD
ncbi:MAG: 5'-nucleotidase [Thiobacillaceae bacterium]